MTHKAMAHRQEPIVHLAPLRLARRPHPAPDGPSASPAGQSRRRTSKVDEYDISVPCPVSPFGGLSVRTVRRGLDGPAGQRDFFPRFFNKKRMVCSKSLGGCGGQTS